MLTREDRDYITRIHQEYFTAREGPIGSSIFVPGKELRENKVECKRLKEFLAEGTESDFQDPYVGEELCILRKFVRKKGY